MIKVRELSEMPFDMRFETERGNEELCHVTGYEVCFADRSTDWWNEYEDSDGNLHYGR